MRSLSSRGFGIFKILPLAAFFLWPALSNAQPVRGVAGDLWADRILGQTDDGTPNFAFGQIAPNQAAPTGLFNPYSVVVDTNAGHNILYVYDSGNNRVLGVTMIGGQVTNGQGAAIVLGQPDFNRTACNEDSNFQNFPNPPLPNGACLCTLAYFQQSPKEGGSVGNMAVDKQGNLYVPDYWNNRVLRYNWPTTTGEAAATVWGQPDFTGFQPNNMGGNISGPPSASSLAFVATNCNQLAAGVGTDNFGNLWVADETNNRVLRFPAPNPGASNPGVPLTTADVVLGQTGFTSNTQGDGTSLTGMSQPLAVRVDAQGNVYVADGNPNTCPINGRVLVFEPTGHDVVTGQPIYGTNQVATANFQFAQQYVNRPVGLEWDPPTGGLWVTDFTASFGPNAGQVVLFQVNVAGRSATANKVLLRDFPATVGGPSASSFTGDISPGFFTDAGGNQVPNWTFPDPRGSVGVDSQGNVYATDDRITDVWRFPNTTVDPIPTIPPAPTGLVHSADVRIFNPLQFGVDNTRFSANPTNMDEGHGIAVASWQGVTQVIAAEGYRLLFWSMPASGAAGFSNGQSASVAGVPNQADPRLEVQPRFGRIREDHAGHLWALRSIDGTPTKIEIYNLPLTPLATPAVTLNGPFNVLGGGTISWTFLEGIAPAPDGSYVWLGNRDNNRVFRLRNPLTTPIVDIILGQTSATGISINQPSGIPSATNLNTPGAVRLDHHGFLYVSDHGLEDNGNYRMLRWNPNTIAAAVAQATLSGVAQFAVPANGVFGTNGSFTVTGCFPGTNPAPGICGPWEPAFNSDDSLMVVGQNSQGPGSRFPIVFSQPETSDNPITMVKDFGPQTFAATFDDQNNLYLAELNRSRVMIYLQLLTTPGPNATVTNTPTVTATNSPTSKPNKTATATPTLSPTLTPTSTPTFTATPMPTVTVTKSPTSTLTNTATGTTSPTTTLTPTPASGCGTSVAKLQLKELTSSCANNQVLDTFEVINNDSPVVLSDITIKFWADDISGVNLTGTVNYGGCLMNPSCFHQVSGLALGTVKFSPACGPDGSHQANWEVTVSNSDSTMLNSGVSWVGIQATVHRTDYGFFSPGTGNWYSPCLGQSYTSDLHYALYYKGNLVTASGGVPPSCRPLPTCTPHPGSMAPLALEYEGATATPTPIPTTPPGLIQSAVAAPNVSHGEPVKFFVPLDKAAEIRLSLFTVTGESVYQATAQGNIGLNTLTWSLQNQGGGAVASGLYIYMIRTDDGTSTTKYTGKVVIFH